MKRRGSVMIFAIVLIVSMTSIIVATVYLTSSLVRDERIFEDQARMRYAIDSVAEQVVQDYAAGTLATFPSTRTPSVNGVTCSTTITDNSSSIPHTMSVTTTATYKGKSVRETKIVGMRKTPSPFYYALFVDNVLTSSATITTGASGINGDIYAKGAVSLTGSSNSINGDLESANSISAGSSTVTGTQYPNLTQVSMPSVSSANYSSIANQTVSKGSLNGATFNTTSGAYWLIYCSSSSVSISGTFTGKGTVFVNGNLTISGPITLGNSSSRVAIIASGNITFTSSGPYSGYFYGMNVTLPTGGITITKGALVCSQVQTTNQPITITNDDAVWLSATEGTYHRLPGFYP